MMLTGAAVGIVFAYTMVEQATRCRRSSKKVEQPSAPSTPAVDPRPIERKQTQVLVRGFDSPDLFRRDTLIRIGQLEEEVTEQRQRIEAIEKTKEKRDANLFMTE